MLCFALLLLCFALRRQAGYGLSTARRAPRPARAAPSRCAACGNGPAEGRSKLFKCVGCLAALYCGAACAAEHWGAHRARCGAAGRARREWFQSQEVAQLSDGAFCKLHVDMASMILGML